jgi:hypothetical protein
MSTANDPQTSSAPAETQMPDDRIALPAPPRPPAAEPAVKPPPAVAPSPEKLLARLVRMDRVLIVLVLGLAFLLAFFPIRNSDFWQQKAVGRSLARGEYRFGGGADAFSSEVPWVNHSWLFGLGTYLLDLLGPTGRLLVVLKALMVVGVVGLILQAGRRRNQPLWVPILCTTLAVVVLSPWLLYQSVMVSYLFLALTLWLLERPRLVREARALGGKPTASPEGGDERCWWLLPVLFVFWVNLDAWFLLGPLTVGLYLLGEVLQQQFSPRGAGADPSAQTGSPSVRTLGLVFLAGLAACLLNPHHIHAFTLPALLGLSTGGSVLQNEDPFLAFFASPLGSVYFRDDVGWSAAGLCYFGLLMLGLLSMVFTAPRWQRVLLFTFFAALSLWRAGAIPFFAIVAGPISALNFLDGLAVRSRTARPVSVAGGRWLLAGRWLSLVGLLLLLLASAPGWLQASPYALRRPGWGVETDPSLERAALQIKEWRDKGLVPLDAHWCNLTPEMADYAAWFCPGAQMFIDQRVDLYPTAAGDYADVQRDLSTPLYADFGADGPKWPGIFRKRGIHYLIFHDPDVLRNLMDLGPGERPTRKNMYGHRTLYRLMGESSEWALLYMDGRTALFGWIDPEKKNAGVASSAGDPFKGLRLNLEHEAFGPRARPAPAARASSLPETRAWYTELWNPTPPNHSLDAHLAQMTLIHYLAQKPAVRRNNRAGWEARLAVGVWGVGMQSANPLVSVPTLPLGATVMEGLSFHRPDGELLGEDLPNDQVARLQPLPWAAMQLLRIQRPFVDMGPPAALYVGLRAARRAVVENPNDARVHLVLAQIYHCLARETREVILNGNQALLGPIRYSQTAGCALQAVTLDPDLEGGYALLAAHFEEQGYYDMYHEYRSQQLRCMKLRGVPPPETPEDWAVRFQKNEEEVKGLAVKMKELENEFEVKTAGKSPLDRAAAALCQPDRRFPLQRDSKFWLSRSDPRAPRIGLLEKALQALEQLKEKDLIQNTANGPWSPGGLAQFDLLFLMGDLGKIRTTIVPGHKSLLGTHPELRMPAYQMYQVRLAAASGDYALAEKAFDELREDFVGATVARQIGNLIVEPLRQYLMLNALQVNGSPARLLAGAQIIVGLSTSVQLDNQMRIMGGGLLTNRANMFALRGWISLEAGRLEQAREAFDEAENIMRGLRATYAMQSMVHMGLDWLNRNAE